MGDGKSHAGDVKSLVGNNQLKTPLHFDPFGFITQIAKPTCINKPWPVGAIPLHWLHNDHDGVSNHQPHGCLLNRLFRRRSKKTSKLRVTGLCVGNSPGPVNSPHKGPVTRKMFLYNYVIMTKGNAASTLKHHNCWSVSNPLIKDQNLYIQLIKYMHN